MADPIISAIAPNIFERCVGAGGEHLGYIWNYKKNMARLGTQVIKLDEEISDKSHCVTVAEKNAQKIRSRVKSWQDEADKVSEEARQVIRDYEEKGKKKCLMGLCPNLVSRYRFSMRACQIETEIVEARKEGEQIKEVADRALEKGMAISLSIKGLFTFDSRNSTLDDIMKTLRDETKNTIGLYGLGGMGKTTLVKQIASLAAEKKMFEEIVMASVTQTVDMKEIQGQIANVLSLKLEESTVAERASRIHGRLKGKKVLVILDDLWKKLDLKDVGIPFGTEHGGCKIVLTSRSLQVLSSMGTEKEFLLGALTEEEAWMLFEEKTGVVLKNTDFHAIGKKVAKRCQGLPVLIVTVAASLSRRPQLPAWKDAFKQLEKMNNKEMHDIVNSAIESISYNHLEKTHKRLFLLCGIIGGNAPVEEVLQYSLCWDLFDEEVVKIEGARHRLHTMILDLKESCLLLDSDSRNSIKMHDVVRDVAINIGKKDLNMFSIGENDAELHIWRKGDALKRCTAIVFRCYPTFPCLPQLLECPSLELCVLSGFSRDSSLTIPDTFFEKTSRLKILDMSGMCFSALPSSLSFLTNLQTLRLDECSGLKDVSQVGELKKLQTLSFVGSDIEELPSVIGQLSELRLLDMRRCFKLKVIPPGLIKGLSQLEELYIDRGFDKWEDDECTSSSVKTNASLLELQHLPNLCSLGITVRDAKFLPKDLCFEKFERYEIMVGNASTWWWLNEQEIMRKVCLLLSTTSINHLQHAVKRFFKRTEGLCLEELRGIENVTPELDGDGFPDLKHLYIKKDYEIQYIVKVEGKQHQPSFPFLESLRLSHLLKLQKICNGQLMEESFKNLTVIKVENCNRLESLFSFSLATGLRCLQKIEVSKCEALEGIVTENNTKDGYVNIDDGGICKKIEFAQLRKLSLRFLPKLKTFFSNVKMISVQEKSQKSIRTDMGSQEIQAEEEELKSSMPFLEKVSLPKLEVLQLSEISDLKEIWSHKLSENYCNVTRLEIVKLDSLEYLLTPTIAMVLVGLQLLTVENCVRMKHIVANEGEKNIETINFPQLSHLCLKNLPNLATFYARSIEEMDSNENLDTVMRPLFNEKVSLPKLDVLQLSEISDLKEIWSHKLSENYCNLTRLEIVKLDSLEYLLTPTIAMVLVGLQRLTVENCVRMKHIVANEGEKNIETINFPQLSHLCLKNLPNLATFYARSIEEMDSNENLDTVMRPLFNEKIQFPRLEKLTMTSLNSINSIWQIPQLFQVNSFCNLERIIIRLCENLKHIFPVSIAQSMKKLENLIIDDCKLLETVIGDVNYEESSKEIIKEVAATFMFPKLANLQLIGLPKVECFYPREHTIECPALKELDVVDCGEVSALDFLSFPETQGDNQFEKMISSLDHLSIRSKDLMKILGLYGHFPPRLFRNLKFLAIIEFQGESVVFPLDIFNILLNQLQTLQVSNCSFQEIFPYEGGVTDHADDDILPLLRRIRLKKLPELEYICKQEQCTPFIPNILNRLEFLIVDDCPRLTNLVPSSVSFRSLRELCVYNCGGLKNLIQPSIARSLKQLGLLIINGCEKIEEIIGGKVRDDAEESSQHAGEIIFSQLWGLKLVKLPRLTSFCSLGNYSFNFPELEIATVAECPNMKTFCGGIVTSPKLGAVRLINIWDGAKRWEGDLNTTVERIFKETEAKRLATTLPSTSLDSHSEAEAQIHENSAEELTEPRIEGQVSENVTNPGKETEIFEEVSDICEKGKGKELEMSEEAREHFEKSKETPQEQVVAVAGSMAFQYAIASSSRLSPSEVEVQGSIVATTSFSDHFDTEAQIHESMNPKLSETSPRRVTEVGFIKAPSDPQQQDSQGSLVSKDLIPSLSESFQILRSQPTNSIGAEHVRFVEDASEWLCAYAKHARECFERNKAISELESRISETEAQLMALKEKKKGIEEENEANAFRVAPFG